ncbi:MAG: MopE-related protein [Myxococcota bacterium]
MSDGDNSTDQDNDGRCENGAVNIDADFDCDLTDANPNDPDPANEDCDDNDADIGEFIAENTVAFCTDGKDNDCDGITDLADPDCQLPNLDNDGDGYCENGQTDSNMDGVCNGGTDPADADCDDDVAGVNPGAAEITANDIDEDCDGVDHCYPDADMDGYGAEGSTAVAGAVDCDTAGDAFASTNDDCEDGSAISNPNGVENTTPLCTDSLDNDCDDDIDSADPDCTAILVENTFALCDDNIDNDGDSLTDEFDPDCAQWADNDGDGYCEDTTNCINGLATGDCDDVLAARNPGGTEIPANDIDEDCDLVDDCYPDADMDGYGAMGSSAAPGAVDCDTAGDAFASTNNDCNDAAAAANPGASENTFALCDDNLNNDCDGAGADELDPGCAPWADNDGDGYCENATNCINGLGTGDCNDAIAARNPGATDIVANDIDENCDGVDHCYPDADMDGYGALGSMPAAGAVDCDTPGDAFASTNNDCADAVATAFPGAPENTYALCHDTTDNDCDGNADFSGGETSCAPYDGTENNASDCGDGFDNDGDSQIDGADNNCRPFYDDDNDGYCESASCATGEGIGGDCDDGDQNEAPNLVENTAALCSDGLDNDCLGGVDAASASCDPFEDNDGDGYCESATCIGGDTPGDCNDSAANAYPTNTEEGVDANLANCTDGVNNDCTGGTDSADVDCVPFGGVENNYSLCTDGFDNDGDGFIDYPNDPECAPYTGNENTFALCNDAFDNDGDGLIGVNDPNCAQWVDNDGDGYCENGTQCLTADGSLPGDCNDSRPQSAPNLVENTFALCSDTFDNDCSGQADANAPSCNPWVDNDGDGYCENGSNCVDGSTAGDCNDSAAGESPGLNEVTLGACMDSLDNDCDGNTDASDSGCNPWVDNDGDGNCENSTTCVDGSAPNDCNDNNAGEDPDNVENTLLLCDDGLNNNCANGTDATDPACAAWTDNDGDGYCEASNGCIGTWLPDDCDDGLATRSPGNPENTFPLCNDNIDNDCGADPDQADEDCEPWADNDGDGYCEHATNCIDGLPANDCNDDEILESPGILENTFAKCSDNLDNNCDGEIDEEDDDRGGGTGQCSPWTDFDGDGQCESSSCVDGSPNGMPDCDDNDNAEFLQASEDTTVCNDGKDNDCDTNFDLADSDCGGIEDLDNDGYCPNGRDLHGSNGSGPPDGVCTTPAETAAQPDCEENNPGRFPGNTEVIADNIDQDCDGGDSCYQDNDNDDFGTTTVVAAMTTDCATEANVSRFNTDCDDSVATTNPAASELTSAPQYVGDGVDNDCDNRDMCWRDNDNDNFGQNARLNGLTLNCVVDAGRAAVNTDCDDAAPNNFPGNTEICDGVDNNCVGGVDEPGPQVSYSTWYRDADGDNHGDPATSSSTCNGAPLNYVASSDDCDDTDGINYPGNPELCDGQDNDCNGLDDAGNAGTDNWETDNDGDGQRECEADCDDTNAQRFTGNTETPANNLDNDCNMRELCYIDTDQDTYGNQGGATQQSAPGMPAWACTAAGLSPVANDCNDTNPTINVAAVEGIADNLDQNCDGIELCYQDADEDGHGIETGLTVNSPDLLCRRVDGESGIADDCNDGDDTIYLGAPEILFDGIDQDCNGVDAVECFEDSDNDDVGVPVPRVGAGIDGDCLDPNESYSSADCNDGNPNIHPGFTLAGVITIQAAPETCGDGVDSDCDGQNGPNWDDDGDGLTFNQEQAIVPPLDDCDPDVDNDSLNDGVEVQNGSNPSNPDTDGDSITDNLEYTGGANPSPRNTDGDAMPDYADTDDDNDGVLTINEAPFNNTDGDSEPDYRDPDDDNDGIPTSVENWDGQGDARNDNTDGDGLPDYRDPDDDNDTILTIIEEQFNNGRTIDFDNDGFPGHRDADSDNDGVSDGVEWYAAGRCPNQPPQGPCNFDAAGGPDIQDLDDDNDTIPTLTEGDETVDTDGDGTPDYLDLDSDADNIGDAVEAATLCMNPKSADTDGDTVPDGTEFGMGPASGNTDTINLSPYYDTLIDPCDEDDDGDTIPTILEVGLNTDLTSSLPQSLQDAELQLGVSIGDDIPNYLDGDDDGDGVFTWFEDLNVDLDATNDDTDGDGIPDALDIDDDNDNIESYFEEYFITDRLYIDSDYDDVRDDIEWGCTLGNCTNGRTKLTPRNTDAEANGNQGAYDCVRNAQNPAASELWVIVEGNADALIDALDPDDDNDRLPTGFIPSGGYLPEFGNGVDTDGDGIPDYRDLDADNDSFIDVTGDGVVDTVARPDVCESFEDFDSDTIPNWIDANDFDGETGDPDGDNLVTALELALGTNPGSPDSDGDGVLDCQEILPVGYVHPDTNATAICPSIAGDTNLDVALWDAQGWQPRDTDGDGMHDAIDTDDDNDGIPSRREVYQAVNPDGTLGVDFFCPNSPTQSRPVLEWRDPDGDDVFEHLYRCEVFDPNDPDTTAETVVVDPDAVDSDGDGLPNRLDADDDGDGFPTVTEDPNGNGDYFDLGPTYDDPTDDDTDGDGILEYLDANDFDGPVADPDQDGMSNEVEDLICQALQLDVASCNLIKTDSDSDGDGIGDAFEVSDPSNPTDSDGDGIADLLDPDDDNDCVPTAEEGVGDYDEDGIPSHLDTDSDDDGISDDVEWFGAATTNCPPFDDTFPEALDVDCDGSIDIFDFNNEDGPCALGADVTPPPDEKCGCQTSTSGVPFGILGLLAVLVVRRRAA